MATRHKKIWRDVLLASLAIQLVGLVTPLFTQVIIDKVVVHQTHSTLDDIRQALQLGMPIGSERFAEVICGWRGIWHNSCKQGRPITPAKEVNVPPVTGQQGFGEDRNGNDI